MSLTGFCDDKGVCNITSYGGVDEIWGTPYPDCWGHWKKTEKLTQVFEPLYVFACAKGYLPNRRYELVYMNVTNNESRIKIRLHPLPGAVLVGDVATTFALSEHAFVHFPADSVPNGSDQFIMVVSDGDSTPKAFDHVTYFWQTFPAIAVFSASGNTRAFNKEITLTWNSGPWITPSPSVVLTVVRVLPDVPIDEEVGTAVISERGRRITASVDQPGIYVLVDKKESERLAKEVFVR